MPAHKGMRRVPDSTRRRIAKLLAKGLNYPEIARQIGCHRNTVWKIANELGTPSRCTGGRRS